MAFCVKCGAQLEEGAGFCTNCGSAQNEGGQTPPQMQPQGGMQAAPQMQTQGGMQQAPQPPKKSRTGLIIGLVCGGVALVAGLVVLILFLTGVIGGSKGGGGETVIAGGTGSTGTTGGGIGGTTTIAGTDEPATTAGGAASGGGSSQGASGNTTGGETDFGYDFETAKQYIGDYQGMVVFEDQVTMAGYDWSNYYRAVYARIVIDEEGEPQVFLRSDLMDSHNFGHTDAWFEEDGTLMMEGILADTEWYDLVFPPENGIIEIWGRIGEPSENRKNFTVLLKPLDETWDRSELPDLIADDQLDTLNRNITNLGDLTLEELLQAVEQHRANKAKENGAEITEETKYTMLTDELPDAYLLELYQ